MLTVGHRGASALAPGNTLLAVRLAVAHRLDYVEVDVHLSRDQQLVVHHDAHCGSFMPELVDEARIAVPEVPRSVLFRDVSMPAMITTCRAVEARYAHPCARPIGPRMIDHLHAAGLLVMTPHTNDPAEANRFRHAGADLVASDDPRLLATLRRTAVAAHLRAAWDAGLTAGAA